MPPADHTLGPDSIIDISHESFMRMWHRLIGWADDEAESTQMYLRLANTALLHADKQAGLWRDPDLQLALEWRLRSQPNATWAERISPGFEQAMQFLDMSRAAHDIEKAEELRLAEQEHELKRSRELTDEQAKRIRAQEKAARTQKQVIALVVGGFVVTTLLSAFALNESKKAEQKAIEVSQQYTQKLNVAKTLGTVSKTLKAEKENNTNLAISKDYSEKLHQILWELASRNGLSTYNVKTVQAFRNLMDQPVLILTLNEQGHQTSPVTIEAGQSRTVDGFVNQIWIARELTQGEVVGTGIMSKDAVHAVFNPVE